LFFSLVCSYLYGFAKKILSLALKNIQASLIFLARLFVSLWLRQEDTFTRFEKYPSKLDISRSFIRIFAKKILRTLAKDGYLLMTK